MTTMLYIICTVVNIIIIYACIYMLMYMHYTIVRKITRVLLCANENSNYASGITNSLVKEEG